MTKMDVINDLTSLDGVGVARVEDFASDSELEAVQQLADDLVWLDAHDDYVNKRGKRIIQNHFTYALDLVYGDMSDTDHLSAAFALMDRTTKLIQSFGGQLPGLAEWTPTELSFHRYDHQDVGLSHHRDQSVFIGVVAIASIEGLCSFSIMKDGEETCFDARPGDLFLLRAPGCTLDEQGEVRPEHAVIDLQTPTRTSMMLRRNKKPEKIIEGFRFNNR